MHWICLGCGARAESRRAPDDCACGVERSWISESETVSGSERAKPVCAADWTPPAWKRLPCGDAAVDRLLGGGWVCPSAALVWARPKVGKSSFVFRWGTAMGTTLVVEREMDRALTISTAKRAGARLDRLHISESLDGWQDDAESLRARVVVFDSLQTLTRYPLGLLRSAYDWCRRAGAVLFVISQVNERGRPAGPIALQHWPDYPVQIAFGRRNKSERVVSLAYGSRFCPPGSAKLRIAPG
jgi:predicted ATP-dependent serine protease